MHKLFSSLHLGYLQMHSVVSHENKNNKKIVLTDRPPIVGEVSTNF
jgi:hypothetical protein